MPTSSDSLITCPHCGRSFALNEAVLSQHRAEIEQQFQIREQAAQKVIAEREAKLQAATTALEQRTQTVQAEVARTLDAERRKLAAAAATQAEEKLGAEMKDLQGRLADQSARLKAAQEAELALRRRERELEEARAAFELDTARKLDAERRQIAEKAREQATEAERLRFAEKEKVIGDLQDQIALLKQRAEQGSIQLQGDVLEIDLEQRLGAAFASDTIEAVATGIRGADIRQYVRTSAGQASGQIIWEAKRAKTWGRDWIAKFKEDQRGAKADIAVLITQILPDSVQGFGLVEGVWISDYANALPLAHVLRQWLISVAVTRNAESGKQEKTAQLYTWLTGPEFRQQVEGIVTAFKAMREDLEAEKRALQKHWSRREKELDRAIGCTASLYGNVQGIAGAAALPDIAPLALPDAR